MESRQQERRKQFKKGLDPEEARRKREDEAVMLRKQKKEESIQKRRHVAPSASPPGHADGILGQLPDSEPSSSSAPQQNSSLAFNAAEFQEGQRLCMSNQREEQEKGAIIFRKMLSMEDSCYNGIPPIQQVIDVGLVPRFNQFLQDHSNPNLVFESAWVLTNIASGTPNQTRAVVDAGALPSFIGLLQSQLSDDVKEQAVWAIGNIAGDCVEFRNQVLQHGALQHLLRCLKITDRSTTIRNATWALSNLCRGKPPPPFESVQPALSTLAYLISSTDQEVLTDACWSLSYLSDGPPERIQAVVNSGVCKRLVQLLGNPAQMVQTPCLRTLGNIATGDDTQTQVIIECGVLPALTKFLDHQKPALRKESAWIISNITAGSRAQIDEVVNSSAIPKLLQRIADSNHADVRKECVFAITNFSTQGSTEQIKYLVEQNAIAILGRLLTSQDFALVMQTLTAIENILKSGLLRQMDEGLHANPYLQEAETHCIDSIEHLQESSHDDVYSKAIGIMTDFFELDDSDDDEDDAQPAQSAGLLTMAPGQQAPVGGFNFGGSGYQVG